MNTKAFTLIETILAVAVISIIITAVAGLTQSSLRIGRTSMNQFIAYHLAEEGLEVVRNLRDSNWLQNRPWRYGFSADGLYGIQEMPERRLEPFVNPAQTSIIPLAQEFRRAIEIKSAGNAIRVMSIVQYEDRGDKKEISLATELTDWKKGPI